MTNTPTFNFRLIAPLAEEAAKISAINENSLIFEGFLKQQVVSRTTGTPPASPDNGLLYIVPPGGFSPAVSGAFVGHENELALFYNGWIFSPPVRGPTFIVVDEDVRVEYDDVSSPPGWEILSGDPDAIHDNVAGEIAAVALKAIPVDADHVLLEDSANSDAKARATVKSLRKFVQVIALSDGVTPITAGATKEHFRAPAAVTIEEYRIALKVGSASYGPFTVDVKVGGVSVLSTLLTIDDGEKTSTTAAVPAVISTAAIADDAEVTFDVSDEGDGNAIGLKLVMIGRYT